jgi:hypothetical protein
MEKHGIDFNFAKTSDLSSSDCLDCQGVTQKTIKELLSNLKSQARKKRSKN